MPYPVLKDYLTSDDNENLRRLVKVCCPSTVYSDPEEIVDNIIESQCLIAFAVLLMIDEGMRIRTFCERDSLSDTHMPFVGRAPEGFPAEMPQPHAPTIWDRFKHQQWAFLPARIEKRYKKIEPEQILPMKCEPLSESGGSADTFKITIHPFYNGLGQSVGNVSVAVIVEHSNDGVD